MAEDTIVINAGLEISRALYNKIVDEKAGKPKTFEIGQKVRIIGPSTAWKEFLGETFVIDVISKWGENDTVYRTSKCIKGNSMPWYPTSSLELVEEAKQPDSLEKQLADLKEAFQEQDRYITDMRGTQSEANSRLRKRIHDLEEWREKHLAARDADQPQGQTIKALFGGQRSGKMASFYDELKKFDWAKEPAYISKILDEPEAIKIGDWVRVNGQPIGLRGHRVGQMDRIKNVSIEDGRTAYELEKEDRWYDACCLHKLSEAEILERLNRGSA